MPRLEFPGRPIPRSIRWRSLFFAGGAAALGLATVTWNTTTAATPPSPGPTVNLNEPVAVTVSGPVEVQGTVDVLNDALRTPFRHTEVVSLPDGTFARTGAVTLPAGKRLVIETVVASASLPGGQNAVAAVSIPGGHNAYLSLQSHGNFGGNTFFVGTHPITLRIDTVQTPTINLDTGRSAGAGTGTFRVSVFGYTEDI